MPFAQYLLEQEIIGERVGAPAGFIFHIGDTEEKDLPAGIGQLEIPASVDHFTHRVEKGKLVEYTTEEKAQHFPEPQKWAQYRPDADGFIHCLADFQVTTAVALARMQRDGIHQVKVEPEVDHYTHKIDHQEKRAKAYTPEEKKQKFPPAPLSVNDHLFLAAVKKGEIDISDVHDSVIADLNTSIEHHLGEENKLVKTADKSIAAPAKG